MFKAASLILLAAFLGVAPVSAAPAAAAAASPAAEVEKYLSGLASWTADFEQTIDDGHGNVLRSAAGRLYLQRPGKFRWDYSQPSEQLVLADGKQIWFYDKDLAQPNVREVDTSLASTPADRAAAAAGGRRVRGTIPSAWARRAAAPRAGVGPAALDDSVGSARNRQNDSGKTGRQFEPGGIHRAVRGAGRHQGHPRGRGAGTGLARRARYRPVPRLCAAPQQVSPGYA